MICYVLGVNMLNTSGRVTCTHQIVSGECDTCDIIKV